MSEAITVIGAGIVGVSTAMHLQQRGWRVTLVERREPGRETSHGNAGVICPAAMVPLNSPELHRELLALLGNRRAELRYDPRHVARTLPRLLDFLRASKTRAATRTTLALAELLRPSLEEHRALMRRSGNLHRLSEIGWLKAFRGAGGFRRGGFGAKLLAECGVALEHHDARSLAELEPALKPVFRSAVLLPGGGRVEDPGALVAEHAARFVADGGELRREDVASVGGEGSHLQYRTAGSSTACERLVIAAGPWSADLLATAGFDVPLVIERGYHAHYALGDGPRPRHSVHDVDAGYVMGATARGLRVTTGVELAPRDAPSDLSQLEQVEPRVREAIDIGERTAEPIWRGARPTLPDSRPAIGALPGQPNLWVNFGHQHIGLMSGPFSGRLLAELIGGETPGIDMAPFAPARCIRPMGRRRRARASVRSG